MDQKYYVIVNPNAGKRKGEKDWNQISALLTEVGFEYEYVFTQAKNHAIHLSFDAISKGYKHIIVTGGDGTLNEVVNGILSQELVPSPEIKLGMIPVGTGNDWGRMYGISKNYAEAIHTIKESKTFIQDAGKVEYYENGKKQSRYFINIAGIGYDALVAKKTNKMKEKGSGGPFSYLINLFLGLLQYKFASLTLNIDGEERFRGKIFSMCVGLCKYNGGGMMQLPNAIPDNGLFDITLIKKASKFKVITNIKNLYDGSFVSLKEVETYTGKKVEIYASNSKPLLLEADGESLGESPFSFEMIPKSICIIGEKSPA